MSKFVYNGYGAMKSHNHLTNAKAIVGLLILGIGFVIFYKFMTNQNYFSDDPEALRNYVMFAIVGGGFLLGLLYLTSKTTHKVTGKIKSVKAKKKKK